MILEKMILENFRVFEGTQEIVFSNDPIKNVTIIHAENGFGKTTFLTSLVWCIYGKHMQDVQPYFKEKIIFNLS